MNARHAHVLAVAGLVLISSAASSTANELPLPHGLYVEASTRCEDASSSNSLTILADRIASAHVVGHVEGVTGRDGVYQVALGLEGDAGMGGGAREQAEWTIRTAGDGVTIENEFAATTYRLCSASAEAAPATDSASYLGSWSTEAACPEHDTKTYSAEAMTSDFAFCPITDIEQAGPGEWRLQAGCLYEGVSSPITFELAVSGDRMRESTITADGNRQELELMRCENGG